MGYLNSLLSFERAAKAGISPIAVLAVFILYARYIIKSRRFAFINLLAGFGASAIFGPVASIVFAVFGISVGIVVILNSILESFLPPNISFWLSHALTAIFLIFVCSKLTNRLDYFRQQEGPFTLGGLLIGSILIAIVNLEAWFGVRSYFSIWGTKLDGLSDEVIFILGASTIPVLMSPVLMIYVYNRFIRDTEWIGRIVLVYAAFGFLSFLAFYAQIFYPILTPALGGGKIEKITIWLKAEDFSDDSRTRLKPGVCADDKKLVRCEGVDSIALGDLYFVLAGEKPPAVIIPVRSVTGFMSNEE